MWIMLSDAFFSIVQPATGLAKTHLLVRARVAGDIERVWPNAVVEATPHRDYAYRALMPRAFVADAMAFAVLKIDYGNFKNSVPEDDRHDAYSRCWGAMHDLQVKREADLRLLARRPKRRGKGRGSLLAGL
jgi:hypothetical protein